MNITNKKLAFYIALVTVGIVMALLIVGQLTNDQAKIIIIAFGSICAALGLSDVGYDYLGIIFKVAETVVALTPSTEDDKQVASLRESVMGIVNANPPDSIPTEG
jgi:hypothetical protein